VLLYKNKDENKKGYQISGARKGRKQKNSKRKGNSLNNRK
jgi:hypothetical protein